MMNSLKSNVVAPSYPTKNNPKIIINADDFGISVYVLIAIVKKRLKLDRSLYTILQILSVSLFEKTPILQVLSSTDYEDEVLDDDNQLNLLL